MPPLPPTSAAILFALGILSLHRTISFRSLFDRISHSMGPSSANSNCTPRFGCCPPLSDSHAVVGGGGYFHFDHLSITFKFSIRSHSIGSKPNSIRFQIARPRATCLFTAFISFFNTLFAFHSSSLIPSPFTSDARRHERGREGMRLYGATPTLLFTSDPADLFNSFIN